MSDHGYVVTTQVMENYGAHTEDGRFKSGNAYWKFKGGTDYHVTGLDRIQDAVAFIQAYAGEDSVSYKEFVRDFEPYNEWILHAAEWEIEYLKNINVQEFFNADKANQSSR